MARRQHNRLRLFVIYLLLVCATATTLVWAMPGAVTCAFIHQTSLTRWSEGLYSQSADESDYGRYLALLTLARERINNTFGDTASKPIFVFFDSDKPFAFYQPNRYGSTQFIGNKACVFIGPEGQNADVVSHELVHADIFHILGPVDRLLHLSTWLDEGLAMQVDYRAKYDLSLPTEQQISSVGTWKSRSDFFDVEHDDELVGRYALAKVRVKGWVEVVGTSKVYEKLKSIVSGGMSEEWRKAGLPGR